MSVDVATYREGLIIDDVEDDNTDTAEANESCEDEIISFSFSCRADPYTTGRR
jgi:hypothetical protein